MVVVFCTWYLRQSLQAQYRVDCKIIEPIIPNRMDRILPNNKRIPYILIIEHINNPWYPNLLLIILILSINTLIFQKRLIYIFFMINNKQIGLFPNNKSIMFRYISSLKIKTFPNFSLKYRKTYNLIIDRKIKLLFCLIVIYFV